MVGSLALGRRSRSQASSASSSRCVHTPADITRPPMPAVRAACWRERLRHSWLTQPLSANR
eukprot:scaffold5717_cov112-Isochrysis_galbana.AAC.6